MEKYTNKFIYKILKDVKPEWKQMWKKLLKSDKGIKIINFLIKKESHINNFIILPKFNDIFNTFKFFDLHQTKMVLLGQDPYIRVECIDGKFIPQAMGLSFSVPNGIKIPPSLRNIFKELKNNFNNFEIPNHGNLTRWVSEENILLLNSALTVEKGKSNSHQKLWNNITDNVIKFISDNTKNVVFLLLGNNAKSKIKLINSSKHIIVSGVHPSPLSANRGFFNSNIFNKINEKLLEKKISKINWKI